MSERCVTTFHSKYVALLGVLKKREEKEEKRCVFKVRSRGFQYIQLFPGHISSVPLRQAFWLLRGGGDVRPASRHRAQEVQNQDIPQQLYKPHLGRGAVCV